MPAVSSRAASSSSSSNHRTGGAGATTSTHTRLAPSNASNQRNDNFAEDDEEWEARESKIPRKGSASVSSKKSSLPSTSKNSLKKVTASSSVMDLDSDQDDENAPTSSTSTARIAALEATVTRLRDERDAHLAHFAQLKSVRSTTVESDLAAYKKAAEARFKHSEDLIKSYKASLDRAERKLRGEVGITGEDDQGEAEENERLRREVESLKRERKKAEEEAHRLSLELRTEVESSRALLSNSKNANGNASFNRDGDNQAVRRLYEDLTGIVISRVELCPPEEGDGVNAERRSYTGAYTAVGHHDLQLSIEESTSTLPSSTSSSGSTSSTSRSSKLPPQPLLRKDLVFRPHLDAQRDADLLASANLPEYLREEIRFDRGLSVKFLGSLEKGLKK